MASAASQGSAAAVPHVTNLIPVAEANSYSREQLSSAAQSAKLK